MGWCKEDISPVRQQWSYIFLVLNHWSDMLKYIKLNMPSTCLQALAYIIYLLVTPVPCEWIFVAGAKNAYKSYWELNLLEVLTRLFLVVEIVGATLLEELLPTTLVSTEVPPSTTTTTTTSATTTTTAKAVKTSLPIIVDSIEDIPPRKEDPYIVEVEAGHKPKLQEPPYETGGKNCHWFVKWWLIIYRKFSVFVCFAGIEYWHFQF